MAKPNKIQTVLSVAACKGARALLRKTGRGGTAVPGDVAMKFARNILEATSEGMEIVVVTGTNGKTTTCSMIEHAITACGKECLLNRSGANLLSGITADLTCNATAGGKPKTHYAVLECDEAALKQVVPLVHPKAIVVTNLFSDQVDRYGGVGNTLREIRTGVEKVPETTLVLNAEEPLSASLSLGTPNPVVWYGLDETVGVQGNVDLKDAGVCPKCGGAYEYSYHIYAHLGGFLCPKCGYRRADPDVAVTAIDRISPDGSTVRMRLGRKALKGQKPLKLQKDEQKQKEQTVQIAVPAVYNVYNAAAAIAAIKALGLSTETAMASLASTKSAFGRQETFDLGNTRLQMILVKNPAGCNQAFSYLTGLKDDFTAVLCLNNQTGDGHDISWINDTDYEKLCADPHVKKIYVCGECAKELSGRLKKAGAGDDLQQIVPDYNTLLGLLKKETRPVFALPNYTSMMEMRKVLVQASGNKEFWE